MNPLEKQTLKHVIERSADLFALKPALAQLNGETITYAILYNRVQSLSQLLRDKGINPGDRVAILGESSPNWGIAFFAVASMGAVAVPVLTEFQGNEVQHIIRHSGARGLLVSNRLFDKVKDVRFKDLQLKLKLDDFSEIEDDEKKDLIQEVVEKGEREFAKLKQAALQMAGKFPESEHSELNEDDLASIIYTSGTTGHSKGVMLSHKNIVFNALSGKGLASLSDTDQLLSILPLAHSYECTLGLVAPILSGSCVNYLDRPPTPRILISALEKVKPTVMLSVPLVIEKIYRNRIAPQLTGNALIGKVYKYKPIRKKLNRIAGKKLLKTFGGNLATFCIGGAGIAPDVEDFLRDAKFPYAIGYGLTETSPLIAGSSPADTKLRSTGPPIEGVEVKIDNPDPESGEGEILARGPIVMKGYYRDEQRTKEMFTEDGWLKTGDLGFVDDDGYLFIKGRIKNLILGSNGKNIYPEEIESLINEMEFVLESLVFDEGGNIQARVHLDYEQLDVHYDRKHLTESEITEQITGLLEQIRQNVNQKLASYARLTKIIEQTDPFVKTPTQKIKRYLYVSTVN